MAILKHIASKNADYGEAQRYLMFQYDEYTGKPILDENGRLLPREEYYLDGINCDPFTFDLECRELNAQYHKNQNYDDIKSHHYILSFDPKDIENGLTGDQAQKLGMEYARKNFPGHQTLVCTHMDGNNESGNIHVHIVINSLRKLDVERETFMERPCDSRAGYKHHLTKDYLIHLKQSVMDICRREHLHQVDLLAPAEKKITEREYHARRRGQRDLDKHNQKMVSEGITPRKTKYQTQKDYLRSAVDEAASSTCTLDGFKKLLKEKYHITLKISRGRFSYLHPERNKPITGRSLGTHYDGKYLLPLFERNVKHNGAAVKSEPTFVFIKSNLRLVVDLQQCIKAQQNAAYAQRVKLSNLQQMAKTVAYVQEHGYNTQEELVKAFTEAHTQMNDAKKSLRSTQRQIKHINEKIHYTGQYLANKSIYRQYIQSANKKKFRDEHQTEIALYETARKILKEQSGNTRLPSIKVLKEEKEKLNVLKNSQLHAYKDIQRYQNELKTVCANVDTILNGGNSIHHEPQMIHDKT